MHGVEDHTHVDAIPISKTRTDYTIPLTFLNAQRNIKKESLLLNINKILNTNDVSAVDYTKGGTNNHKLEPLNNLFCDNIILYYIIPEEYIALIAEEEQKVCKDSETEERTAKPEYIKYKGLLAEHTAKIVRIFDTLHLPITKPCIKPTSIHDINTTNGISKVQLLKVSMANCVYNDIINLIENHTQTLNKEGIYIHDIDFTQDYKGVFAKEALIRYMLDNNFRYKGGNHKYDTGLTCDEAEGTILDNDGAVGRNCLSFMRDIGNGAIRYKFYNKFVQSMESPSVRKHVGNHFANWCNNPERELQEAIPKSLDTGLLRLEITFYRTDTAVTQRIEQKYIEEQMLYLEHLIPPALLFHNSIANQWKLLLEQVHYNTVLLDTDSKLALVSLYNNKETGKVNGFYIRNVNENTISNIVKLYTFDIPIVVLLLETKFVTRSRVVGVLGKDGVIECVDGTRRRKLRRGEVIREVVREVEDIVETTDKRGRILLKKALVQKAVREVVQEAEEGEIEVQQDVYTKALDVSKFTPKRQIEKLTTLCTNGFEYFKQCYVSINDKQPEDVGLCSTNKCTLVLPTKRSNYNNSLTSNIPIRFEILNKMDFDLLKLDFDSVREHNRKIKTDRQERFCKQEDPEVIRERQEKIAVVEAKNKEAEQKLAQQQQYRDIEHKFEVVFNREFRDIHKLSELADGKILHCYGFRTISTRYGDTFILACCGKKPNEQDDPIIVEDKDIGLYNTRRQLEKAIEQKQLSIRHNQAMDRELKAYWGTTEIKAFIHNHIQDWQELDSKLLGRDAIAVKGNNEGVEEKRNRCYGTKTETPLFSFRKVGIITNAQRNKQVSIEILEFKNKEQEATYMRKIASKAKDATPIEKLITGDNSKIHEGDVLAITGHRALKGKLILEVLKEEDGTTYIVLANHWLKQIFAAKESSGIVFYVVVGECKSTPSYRKEHMFITDA